MTEQIDEQLHRYLDDVLSPEEAAAFAERLAEDAELAEEVEAMELARSLLRADIESAVEAADFSGFADAIANEIADIEVTPAAPERAPVPAEPEPTGLRGWWQRWWTPLVVSGAAAAVIVGLLIAGKSAPATDSDELTNGAIAVDAIENEGTKTILVSQPAEDGEATVIWMLDEEDEAPEEELAPGEDPI